MRILSILLCAFLLAPPAFSLSGEQQADRLEMRLRAGKLGEDMDKAIDTIIFSAVKELRRRNYYNLGKQIHKEWQSHSGFYKTLHLYRDVGDHPAIIWLYDVHSRIEKILGEKICKIVRTHDLYTLAFTIPVVFKCVDHVTADEYKLHFVPFLGVVFYWVTNGVCLGLTWGMGYGFFCGPIALAAEYIAENRVAPRRYATAYKLACLDQSELYFEGDMPIPEINEPLILLD